MPKIDKEIRTKRIQKRKIENEAAVFDDFLRLIKRMCQIRNLTKIYKNEIYTLKKNYPRNVREISKKHRMHNKNLSRFLQNLTQLKEFRLSDLQRFIRKNKIDINVRNFHLIKEEFAKSLAENKKFDLVEVYKRIVQNQN